MKKTIGAPASDLLARLPTMTDAERGLGLEIYRQLSHGEPVSKSRFVEKGSTSAGTRAVVPMVAPTGTSLAVADQRSLRLSH